MKTNSKLQRNVLDELRWDPMLAGTEIGVAAKAGVVTLSGTVGKYSMRLAAIRAAERVAGVHAVADDITVKTASGFTRTDTEIAHAALNALKWDSDVPDDRIQVEVANGWLTLGGSVDWYYQKKAAEGAVRYLTGVRGMSDNIMVKSPVSTVAVKSKIEAALKRSAEVDSQRIKVMAADGTVTLSGSVRSPAERRDAEWAAWGAPGVREVRDNLVVAP